LLFDNILLHSFVAYQCDSWEPWYLTINGEQVGRGRGFIFGFTGKIFNWLGGFGTKFDYFDIDGFGMIIIHISD
jgi:hypothetical protein